MPPCTKPNLWPLGLYRVAGESMLPAYRPGDTLIGLRWFRPRVGHVVVARQGGYAIVKRIAKLDDQLVWLAGDNRDHSTDSRHFGPLDRTALMARIIVRLG